MQRYRGQAKLWGTINLSSVPPAVSSAVERRPFLVFSRVGICQLMTVAKGVVVWLGNMSQFMVRLTVSHEQAMLDAPGTGNNRETRNPNPMVSSSVSFHCMIVP
jgi:hypothetical protein